MIGAQRSRDTTAKKDKNWFSCHSPIARKYSFLRVALIMLACSLPGIALVILDSQDDKLFKA